MNTKRLLLLADYLSVVPPRRFHLSQWVCDSEVHPLTRSYLIPEAPLEETCGFVACAVGWACTLPEFAAEGLTFYDDQPHFANKGNWEAVEAFFEISCMESQFLFSEFRYAQTAPEPLDVADRIRKFLANPNRARQPDDVEV